jgi:hypothetical protein
MEASVSNSMKHHTFTADIMGEVTTPKLAQKLEKT